MKIELQSMRVVNCGPLKDVEIDFSDGKGNPRQTILLAGANGSGKTTILELIFGLAELLYPSDSISINEEGIARPYLRISDTLKRTGYAQMDLRIDEADFSIFYGERPHDVELAKIFYGRQSGIPAEVWEDQYPFVTNIRAPLSQQEHDFFDVTQISFQQDQVHLLPSVLYLPHYRTIPLVKPSQVQREEIPYRWIYKFEPTYEPKGSLDSYLVWLDYADNVLFDKVVDFLNQLDFNGKTFAIPDSRKKDLKVIVRTKDGSEHYLEDLSSGEQSILITLLQLRLRLLPGSIVLIDEIEHSLHPAFQYRIAEGLKRMQEMIPFQLIATTHAPAFLDIFGAENTLILTEF